jgi:hypothetical protein
VARQQPAFDRSQPNELDHIEHAVRLARAWHATTTGQLGGQLFLTEEDVICPSETHLSPDRSLPPDPVKSAKSSSPLGTHFTPANPGCHGAPHPTR